MRDREIAYEQNVTGLEKAWAERIESFAREAVRAEYRRGGRDGDREGVLFDATEVVTARLLDSERWANVTATDISDIAYEAVNRVLDAGQ